MANKNARYPAIPKLKNLNKFQNTTVFLDDASRPQEIEIVKLWEKENQLKDFSEYECDKSCVSFQI